MEIPSINIDGRPRKLKANWGVDIEKDLMLMMSIDIQQEIDREIINKMAG
jgi:hypothetical protein